MTARLRLALVGGPMYDHLYSVLAPDGVEIVVHADHPTLNRRVAEMLGAGERLDLVSTHSKYAPSQDEWLLPLEDIVPESIVGSLAPRAVNLCAYRGRLLCLPRLIDVRILWVRRDRVAEVPATWEELADSEVAFGFPGRESGLFGTFFEIVAGQGVDLFDASGRPTMASTEAESAVALLCRLAAKSAPDLHDWHYDDVDKALGEGRIDAAGVWPGGWGAIRDGKLAGVLEPFPYPAGPKKRVTYAGCHAWAIPRSCGNLEGALEMLLRLSSAEVQAVDASGGNVCASQAALGALQPSSELDARRLSLTSQMIEEAMITYPPLARFPEIEDAGWSAIRDALLGRATPAEAVGRVQLSAERVLSD